MAIRHCALPGLVLATLASCSGDSSPADSGRSLDDAAVDGVAHDVAREASPPDGEVPLTLPPGDDGHADVSEVLSASQVRAGRVRREVELLSGPKLEGRVGDFKLYNARAAFIIEDARASDGAAPFGGELLDAMLLDPPADSAFGEMAFGIGTQIIDPTSVGVVSDGSDGQPAVVRVIGRPAALPQIAALIGDLFGGSPPVHIVYDYVLAPDSDVLEIRCRLFNTTRSEQAIPLTLIGMSAGDGLRYFIEGVGFGTELDRTQSYLLLAAPPGTTGYLIRSPGLELKPVIAVEGLLLLSAEGMTVPAAGEVQRTYQVELTRGDPEDGLRRLRRLQGVAEPDPLTGVVRDPSGTPVAGARVHVQQHEATVAAGDPAYVTMTHSDAAGAFAVGLAAGQGYLLRAVADGRGRGETVALDVSAQPPAPIDLGVGATATLRHVVSGGDGNDLPAKLILQRSPPLEPLPEGFGEPRYPQQAELVTAVNGTGELALAPGSYSATAARGFEYELASATFELAAGAVHEQSFALQRTVDTSGYLCGDLHLHGMRSPDSSDTYRRKAAWLAAEGVELAVITDHDYLAVDLGPQLLDLELERWVLGLVGVEITTVVYGHFNVFPLLADPAAQNRGAPQWVDRTPAELLSEVRADWPAALLQVNHPRSPSIAGYFNAVGYDPLTGQASKIPTWSRDFDLLEVFNGKRLPDDEDWTAEIDELLVDWLSLLDRGLLVTATGNSDSHEVVFEDVGYPRNCVRLGADEPAAVSQPQLLDALRAQRVVVSGGPFVDVSIGDRSLGEVAPAPAGGEVLLAVRVQAPAWIVVDRLRVLVSGLAQHDIALDATTADPSNPVVRYQGLLPLIAPQTDTHVVVVVTGSTPLAPVNPGARPFALTNPIYLDVDGNGRYDPPRQF